MLEIVVIDDSPMMLDVVSAVLDEMGHKVTCYLNGNEAIAGISHASPDLIISDVHMPELNGFDLTRQLRADIRHVGTPVLLLTADATPEFAVHCRDSGVTAWLKKPFKPEELQRQVKRLSF
jgi:CheY-like chemotaxis protein